MWKTSDESNLSPSKSVENFSELPAESEPAAFSDTSDIANIKWYCICYWRKVKFKNSKWTKKYPLQISNRNVVT